MRTIPDAVCWYEGMPMLPQHFQMQVLRHETLMATLATQANPWFWGVTVLQIDNAALCSGVLRILRLQAIMPDGLPVDYDIHRDAPLEFDCQTLLPATPDSAHQLWLAVSPACRAGQWQLMEGRYRSINSAPIADLASGEFPESIPLWQPAPRIVSHDQRADLICLPLIQVVYSEGGFRQNDWFAPSPRLNEECYLTRRVRRLCLLAREKCLFLSREALLARQNERSHDWLSLALSLQSLQGALPLIESLINSSGTHPQDLFHALSLFVGQTAILQPEKPLPLLPGFDYQNMFPVFDVLFSQLESNLARIHRYIERRHFSEQGNAFFITPPADAHPGDRLVIGVIMPPASTQTPEQWLRQSIIASQPFLNVLRRQRMHGMTFEPLAHDLRKEWESDDAVALFVITLTPLWLDASSPLFISPLHETDSGPARVTLYLREDHHDGHPR